MNKIPLNAEQEKIMTQVLKRLLTGKVYLEDVQWARNKIDKLERIRDESR